VGQDALRFLQGHIFHMEDLVRDVFRKFLEIGQIHFRVEELIKCIHNEVQSLPEYFAVNSNMIGDRLDVL